MSRGRGSQAWQLRSQTLRGTLRREVEAVKAQGAEAPSASRPWEGASGGRVGSSSEPEADTVGARARQLQALQRRQPCQQCGGRGVVAGIKSPVPCNTCQTWRRSPSYTPGQSLLNVRDLNLSALDGDASSSGAAARQGSSRRLIDDAPASTSGREGGKAGTSRQKRPMPEAQREAIKAALQNRGPISSDHKRCAAAAGPRLSRSRIYPTALLPPADAQREGKKPHQLRLHSAAPCLLSHPRRSISRAMRDAHAKNPMLSGSGRPKKCSHCGGEGHNKLTCPVLHPERAQQAVEAAAARLLPTQRLCSVCGLPGHYKNQCPEAAAAAAAAAAEAASRPRKLIVVEDEAAQAGSEPAAEALSSSAAAAAAAAAPGQEGGAPAAGAGHAPGGSAPVRDPAAGPRGSGAETAPLSLFTDYSGAAVARDLVPTVKVGPGMSLSPEGSWVFPLPARREDCVQQVRKRRQGGCEGGSREAAGRQAGHAAASGKVRDIAALVF